jgi:hypothetical protein
MRPSVHANVRFYQVQAGTEPRHYESADDPTRNGGGPIGPPPPLSQHPLPGDYWLNDFERSPSVTETVIVLPFRTTSTSILSPGL